MNRYFGAFYDLLRKAGAAIIPSPTSQPRPVVQPGGPEKIPAKISAGVPEQHHSSLPYTESDLSSHNRKEHYFKRGKADEVVRRSVEQNPHQGRSLHSYACPVCKHHGSVTDSPRYLVGHKPLSL